MGTKKELKYSKEQYLKWYEKLDGMTGKYRLVLVHPGAGKSTRLKWEAIRRIVKDRKYKIAYLSKSAGKAKLFRDSIADELQKNQKLINDFGKFYDSSLKWNNEAIKVIGSGTEPTPTLSCYGITTQIEGMRPNMMILDDPIDKDTVLSPAESETMAEKLTPWIERLDIA